MFNEEIRNNHAIVYHRTGKYNYNLINDIKQATENGDKEKIDSLKNTLINGFFKSFVDKGINKNSGMYGPGAVYNTYDLESQLNGRMVHYGPIILKSYVKLNKFIVFDIDVAKKLYTPKFYKISQQFKMLGILPTSSELRQYISTADSNPVEYSAHYANLVSNTPEFEKLVRENKIQGIIYTGSQDGKCCVVYNDSLVVPMSYAVSVNDKLITPWYKLPKGSAYGFRKGVVKTQKIIFDLSDSRVKRVIEVNDAVEHKDWNKIEEMLLQKYITPHYHLDNYELIFSLIPKAPLELLKLLIEKYSVGINTIAKNKDKESILTFAVKSNRFDFVQYLLKYNLLMINYTNMIDNLSAPALAYKLYPNDSTTKKLLENPHTKFSIRANNGKTIWQNLNITPGSIELGGE
jgi:hypothetical protein